MQLYMCLSCHSLALTASVGLVERERAMWDLHAVIDRILSIIPFRHHLYFLYLPVSPQRHGVDEAGEPEPPMLQEAIMISDNGAKTNGRNRPVHHG